MAVVNQPDFIGLQQEVQRLLGRCVLRLQQYESLLKAMIAEHSLSGTPEVLPHALDVRKAEVSDKTLGMLIGRLIGDYILKEGDDPSDDSPNNVSDSIHFGFPMQLILPAERYETLKTDLRALVALRNSLVHHFIELHDLRTVEGCRRAQEVLTRSYTEIDLHFEQLASFAGQMDEARKTTAEFMQSPQLRDLMVNGLGPDGQIHWPVAGIVTALREAYRELSIDGWVNLRAAALWVSEHQPEQTPRRYGCSRWRQVIHESRQFELRRFTHNGKHGAWIRERQN